MVVALVGLGVPLVAGFNVAIHPYGLYRDTHGRRLPAYRDSRVSKYLLRASYVRENFDSILIGSYISANWEMSGVEKLGVCDESLNGGNIAEAKAVVDQALSGPGISIAFLIVHPFLTNAHNFETVTLDRSVRYSALGSENLLHAYKEMFKVRLNRGLALIDAAGTKRFDTLKPQLNPTLTLRPLSQPPVSATR